MVMTESNMAAENYAALNTFVKPSIAEAYLSSQENKDTMISILDSILKIRAITWEEGILALDDYLQTVNLPPMGEYITRLVLDGTPYFELERMVRAQMLSMDSDDDKFITEVMLEGMLCVQKIMGSCETAAVMLSFVPINTREMCTFYNKASSLFLHEARSKRKADRGMAEAQHSHGGGYMDLPESLLSQGFIETTLAHSCEVLAVEANRAALEHIIVSAVALLDKARNNGLSSLDEYTSEDIYPIEEANNWEEKDGVPCPLPPLLNMGVLYIADGFVWENTASIIANQVLSSNDASYHLLGLAALTGLKSIQEGENPHTAAKKLLSFIPMHTEELHAWHKSLAAKL